MFEDALYGQNSAARNFGVDQAQSVLGTVAMRTITGIASHALYTALSAAGLIYLLGTPTQPRRIGRGLLLMLSAMLVHGVWDSAAALAHGTILVFAVMFLTTLFALVVLFIAIRLGADREREFMRAVLAPEVTSGTITEPELAAAVGHRRRDHRSAVEDRPEGTSRHRERLVLRAVRDPADDICAAGGGESTEVDHSRSEIARLRRH